ncbi:transposase [Streptomyces olivaceus]|uniref:transposase n=1 Tax=Streptomyces olivaceus TaxID=47716 RepID=UPI0035D92171
MYGAGHSERVVAKAIGKHRDEILIATKWGNVFDESTRRITAQDAGPVSRPTHVLWRVESLTDAQWSRLEPLLPCGKKPGRPPVGTGRQPIDGVRWRTRAGAGARGFSDAAAAASRGELG